MESLIPGPSLSSPRRSRSLFTVSVRSTTILGYPRPHDVEFDTYVQYRHPVSRRRRLLPERRHLLETRPLEGSSRRIPGIAASEPWQCSNLPEFGIRVLRARV